MKLSEYLDVLTECVKALTCMAGGDDDFIQTRLRGIYVRLTELQEDLRAGKVCIGDNHQRKLT